MNLADLPRTSTLAGAPRCGAFRQTDRETIIVGFEADADAIRAALPAPLVPDGSNAVMCEFAVSPAESGLGFSTEFSVLVPALRGTERVLYRLFGSADDDPAARGRTRLVILHDTSTGVFEVNGRPAVIVSMNRGTHLLEQRRAIYACSAADALRQLQPQRVTAGSSHDFDDADGHGQLISHPWTDIRVQSAWIGPVALEIEIDARVPGAGVLASLPVRRVLGGLHCVINVTRERPRRLVIESARNAAAQPSPTHTGKARPPLERVAEGGLR